MRKRCLIMFTQTLRGGTAGRFLPLVVFLLAPSVSLPAAEMLFDFEDEAELKMWHDEGRATLGGGKSLELAERFVASGRFSLCFRTPKWKPGMAEWPAYEGRPAITDWSGYDRLVFCVTNATAFQQRLSLFVTDSKVPTRSGLKHRVVMAPFSFTPVVISLSQLAQRKVSRQDVRVMHFFTERPPGDMEVYLDRIMLLRPGEAEPAMPTAFIKDFAELQTANVQSLRQAVRDADRYIQEKAAPEALAWARSRLAGVDHQVTAFANQVKHSDAAILESRELNDRLQSEISRLKEAVDLWNAFEKVRPSWEVEANARTDVVVGFATSMEKVLPRAVSPAVRFSRDMTVSVARNEKESFQVVVLPCEREAKAVQLRPTDLKSTRGAIFAARNIAAAPVGYVETKSVPPYGSSHVGWWPDPILDFLPAADIAATDAQAFWIRVQAPKDQQPGRYIGKMEVVVEDAPVYAFELKVVVHPFAVPDRSPLPLAITFWPHDHPTAETRQQQEKWRKSADYPINAWRQQRRQWGDFLADYYITYDSLYSYAGWAPDFEILKRLDDRGQLGMFNLGYYGTLGESPAALEAWKKNTLNRIKNAYDRAETLGLLDHAYIYGCDEHPAERFPGVQRAADRLKQECPNVPVMTTTYDHSFGADSVIKSVDAFCPLTPRFDPRLAAQARGEGKQVWWYICCGPRHPHANMFVEYPAIEGRLLMGAQTAKYRPDGFLCYQISI